MISVLCKPDTNFDLIPVDDLPECKAWCPAEKANPPNETGLAFRGDQVRYVPFENKHLPTNYFLKFLD